MGDDDGPMTIAELRRWYAEAVRRCGVTETAEDITASVALAAEVRAALGEAGVFARVESPVQAASPWRAVATDPPRDCDWVLGWWPEGASSCQAVYCFGSVWSSDERHVGGPRWWMSIPPLPLPEVAS